MSDASNETTEKPQASSDDAASGVKPRRRGAGNGSVKAGADAVRSRLASVVWLVAVICALFLAIGALVTALDMNLDNPILAFINAGAHKLDFGQFKDFGDGKNAKVESALVNWGIAAVIYLVVGKILDRLIRP